MARTGNDDWQVSGIDRSEVNGHILGTVLPGRFGRQADDRLLEQVVKVGASAFSFAFCRLPQ
jgi:hypothetical protein